MYTHLCLIDIQICGFVKWFHKRHLDFAKAESLHDFPTEGMEKEGKDPLSEEPSTLSTGRGGGPTFIIEGMSKCFDTAPYLRSPLVPTARRGCVYSDAHGPQFISFS